MNFSLTAMVGAESTDDIVRFLFTPIRPWEENMLLPEAAPVRSTSAAHKNPNILKTIRFLKS